MAETVRILRLLVASPGDVAHERNAVSTAAVELNKGVALAQGIQFQVIRWETDAYPSFHPAGPQGAIDKILRVDDCDIVVGIFWKRFGTPTADGRTGTEHELNIAYESWKATGRPNIMLYFSRKPYQPETKEELEQWQRVLTFKSEMQKSGLIWAYPNPHAFEQLIRRHLTALVLAEASPRQSHDARRGPGSATDKPDEPPSIRAKSNEQNSYPASIHKRSGLDPAAYLPLLNLLRTRLTADDLRMIAGYYGLHNNHPRPNLPDRLPGSGVDERTQWLVEDALRTQSMHVLLEGVAQVRPDLRDSLPQPSLQA
jgi:hypothetical protein